MKVYTMVLKLLFGMMILALVTGCNSAKKAAGLQNGEYKNLHMVLNLRDGKYSMGAPNEVPWEVGSYELKQDKIVFHVNIFAPKPNSAAGCGSYPDYSYHWTFDTKTNQLTFSGTTDPCSPRLYGFTAAPLTFGLVQN
jgi:hypothetical protein